MEFQLSPHSQMLDWYRQSVTMLATPSRTLNLQLLACPQDLSLCISPCVSSTWSRVPLFFKKRKEAPLVTLLQISYIISYSHPLHGPGPEIFGVPVSTRGEGSFRRKMVDTGTTAPSGIA